MTYWISLNSDTFGLVAKNGVIVDAPPAARWTKGREAVAVLDVFRRKGARIDWAKTDA